MASVNKVIIVGNLGRDPETRYMPNGEAVTNIAVATTESWKDKQTGEKREQTEWHRIVFYRKLAEIAGQYLKKGSQVYIEGRLFTRKWTDKDGVERYTTEIIADTLQMLGARQGGDGGYGGDAGGYGGQQQRSQGQGQQRNQYADQTGRAQPQGQRQQPQRQSSNFDDMSDDIPF